MTISQQIVIPRPRLSSVKYQSVAIWLVGIWLAGFSALTNVYGDDSLESQLLEGLPAIAPPDSKDPTPERSPIDEVKKPVVDGKEGDTPKPSRLPVADAERPADHPREERERGNEQATPSINLADEGEDIGQTPKSEDPLARVLLKMRSSRDRLKNRDSSSATQSIQQQIVRELEAMLSSSPTSSGESSASEDQTPKEGTTSQEGPGDGMPSTGPTQESDDRVDPATASQAQLAEVKSQLRRAWGHLPEKVREKMLSSMSEEFLPKYEKLIEAYYKRLAEEPTTRP